MSRDLSPEINELTAYKIHDQLIFPPASIFHNSEIRVQHRRAIRRGTRQAATPQVAQVQQRACCASLGSFAGMVVDFFSNETCRPRGCEHLS